ncbi:long tail fiber protein distal subunit [Salmonella phage pSe_SNUABM_01]|uniref:Long tail fiber protein Gp37 n=1 Tax=Salmonella phage pSe_SNUABM_01 TaxID=2656520 RepID=A0A6B9KMW8_9CAUD|nr:long tail fiber protein distal subunit [Salmonella phage pSe_SNUABM_01]QHA33626.1 putative long tail fiber distal subunit [Salmonella phage pSe_SNUABM_01]
MATLKQIQFKRSKTAGARPAASVLAEGELAINLKDRVLFTKDDQGNIIDLGFAKGGSIDGNVIHIGNYNQTGDYTLNGTFTQTGNFNLTGIARVTRDIIAAGQIMTEGGELITKSSGTAHVRFFDGNNRERGIIYAPANDGLTTQVLNIRVQDYAAGDESTYAFSGSGLFTSPEVSAWKSISSPQILTDKVITDWKKTGDYDISSLANNNSDTDKNYLRIVRTDPAAAMLHEICENNGISWYSGSTPTDYMLSFSYSGGLQAGHSIAVGMESSPMTYSALGKGSIAIGDNDTGFKWHQDGHFHAVNNGTRTFIYGPAETQSLRKMVMGYSPDGILMTTPPTENYALATVVTYHDNNAYGDGQTLLGYYQGGNYHHYFRGKGTTNINTHGGLLVTPGNIDVIGGSVNIDGRNNNSTLMFKGYTMGQSSVDNMYIAVWGNTFSNPSEGTRKNVMEISDDIGWMHYIQRTTAGKIESVINGTQIVNENFTVVKNATFDGTISAAGEIATNAVNGLRIWNADYGAIFRRSEGSLHIIPTAYGEGKHGDIGPLRPFSMALDTGKVTIPDLQSSYNTFAANGYIKFVGHGAGAGGYDIQYVQAAPIFQEIDDDAVNKYYPIVKQKYLQGKAVWSLGTEINSGTFVIHHIKEDGTQGHTSRFNADGTVNFPDNVLVGGDINMKGLMTFDAGRLGSRDYFKFNHWGDSNNARDNIIQLEDSKGVHFSTERTLATGAIKTKFFGEVESDGRLIIKRPGDSIVLSAPASNSLHIRGDVDGTNNWYIGKGGDDNGLAFYSYATNAGVYITNAGDITLSPKGVEMAHVNNIRLYVHGERWTASQPGDWGNQWRVEAPIFVDHGYVSQDCYYPILKARSVITNQGYSTAVDFGMRRIPSQWGQAIIRVGSTEASPDAGHPQAVFEFHHDGFFYTPGNGSFSDVYIRSDSRLKINKEELEYGAVEKVCRLKVYIYDKVKSIKDRSVIKREVGIIAQDLEKELPEAVSKVEVDGSDVLTISNSAVNALLIKAIQEMSEEIKELKTPLFTKIARKISKYFKF